MEGDGLLLIGWRCEARNGSTGWKPISAPFQIESSAHEYIVRYSRDYPDAETRVIKVTRRKSDISKRNDK